MSWSFNFVVCCKLCSRLVQIVTCCSMLLLTNLCILVSVVFNQPKQTFNENTNVHEFLCSYLHVDLLILSCLDPLTSQVRVEVPQLVWHFVVAFINTQVWFFISSKGSILIVHNLFNTQIVNKCNDNLLKGSRNNTCRRFETLFPPFSFSTIPSMNRQHARIFFLFDLHTVFVFLISNGSSRF